MNKSYIKEYSCEKRTSILRRLTQKHTKVKPLKVELCKRSSQLLNDKKNKDDAA